LTLFAASAATEISAHDHTAILVKILEFFIATSPDFGPTKQVRTILTPEPRISRPFTTLAGIVEQARLAMMSANHAIERLCFLSPKQARINFLTRMAIPLELKWSFSYGGAKSERARAE
jgi:hypothetical protein